MWWLDGIIDLMDMNLGRLQEMVRDREAWRAESIDCMTEQQQVCKWLFYRWENQSSEKLNCLPQITQLRGGWRELTWVQGSHNYLAPDPALEERQLNKEVRIQI